MGVDPTNRKADRARSIRSALKQARARHSWATLRELQRRSGVSASTISRIEDPELTDLSPQVDTLEALAEALACPLTELLGEPQTIEYRGLGDWPEALVEVIAEDASFVGTAKRAYIEHELAELRSWPGPPDGPDPKTAEEYINSKDVWRERLDQFRRLRHWRVVELLIEYGWGLHLQQNDGLKGLEMLLRSMVSCLPQGTREEWIEETRGRLEAMERARDEEAAEQEKRKKGGNDG